MKFQLVEKIVLERDLVDDFTTTPGMEARIKFLRDGSKDKDGNDREAVLEIFRKNGLAPIEKVIEASALEDGLGYNNEFLQWLMNWDGAKNAVKTKDAEKKFTYLFQAYKSNNIDINDERYENESLYDRGYNEFVATTNLLNSIYNPNAGSNSVTNYLQEFTEEDKKDLYVDHKENGKIKPYGKWESESERDPENRATLVDVMDYWTNKVIGKDDDGNDIRNEVSPQDRMKNNTARSYQRRQKDIDELTGALKKLSANDLKAVLDNLNKK